MSQFFFPQDLDQLSKNIASYINDFFVDKNNVHTSIIKFEDFSNFSDLMAQKFYQLLVSKFEASQTFHFKDMMINFNGNSGEFNLNNINQLNYFIFLKLIRNRDKLGAGVVIFSKSLDRIVGVHYREVLLNAGEINILNTVDYGFQSVGFSKIVEINAQQDLLDIKSIQDPSGDFRYFFYYPNKINIFKHRQTKLEKVSSFDLNWERPYYPVLEYEGKLSVFIFSGIVYLTAGNNFSPYCKVLKYQDNRWNELPALDFIPFKLLRINDQYYLSGSKYEEGKNFFKNKIILALFDSMKFNPKKYFEKKVPAFYSLAFSSKNDQLFSIHMIDRQYRYRFFSDNFEEQTMETEKRGASLSSTSDEWLAVSDYSRGSDTLYFYKIKGGSRHLVYQQKVKGEIVFISEGQWKSFSGFWVFVKKSNKYGNEFVLQFWSKREDTERDQENNLP